MTRRTVIQRINNVLDTKCGNCNRRREMNECPSRNYSILDKYCNKVCVTGTELQLLGRELCKEGIA